MMKRTILYLFIVSLSLTACSAERGKILMSGKKFMCLSEYKETCTELASEKCFGKGYQILREEAEDNTWPFEDDRYILTFSCNK